MFYCVLLYTQIALQSYERISPQPAPVCSIHLENTTAATATGGEEREIEPVRWMGIIRSP